MKILFVLDYIYSGETINIKLAKRIASQLSQRDCEVWFLCNSIEMPNGLDEQRTVVFTTLKDKVTYQTINNARQSKKTLLGTIVELLKNPQAMANLLSTILLKKSLAENIFKKEIEHLNSREKFDAVISVSCPHYSMFALANSNINTKKTAYILDPFWSNKTMPYAVNLKREIHFYQKIDVAIITDLMYKENCNSPIGEYKQKMQVLAFPVIEEKTIDSNDSSKENDDKVHCNFVGNLYANIRDPKYIFELAAILDEKIYFSFTGGGYEGFPKGFFENYKSLLKERLVMRNSVSQYNAEQIIQSSDILINIGNSIDNQLPSKVFEYINTGKPIINFYKIDNCPTLPYLEKYPLSINVKEGDFSDETVQKINNFCISSKGKKIEHAKIEELYSDLTVKSVADKFFNIIIKE